jgi:hypothetical protein
MRISRFWQGDWLAGGEATWYHDAAPKQRIRSIRRPAAARAKASEALPVELRGGELDVKAPD